MIGSTENHLATTRCVRMHGGCDQPREPPAASLHCAFAPIASDGSWQTRSAGNRDVQSPSPQDTPLSWPSSAIQRAGWLPPSPPAVPPRCAGVRCALSTHPGYRLTSPARQSRFVRNSDRTCIDLVEYCLHCNHIQLRNSCHIGPARIDQCPWPCAKARKQAVIVLRCELEVPAVAPLAREAFRLLR